MEGCLPESAQSDADFLRVPASIKAPRSGSSQIDTAVPVEIGKHPAGIEHTGKIGFGRRETQSASRHGEKQ